MIDYEEKAENDVNSPAESKGYVDTIADALPNDREDALYVDEIGDESKDHL